MNTLPNTAFKAKPIVAALAAAGLSATAAGVASAADITAGPVTGTLIAPFTTSFQVGDGLNHRFLIELDAAATAGNVVVAMRYQGAVFAGPAIIGPAGAPIAPTSYLGDVVVTAAPPAFDRVIFITDIGNAVDAYGPTGLPDEDNYGIITPGSASDRYTLTVVNDPGWKTANAVGSVLDFAGIAANVLASAPPAAVRIVGPYNGPRLTTAEASNPANPPTPDVKLTFDAALDAIAGATSAVGQISVQDAANNPVGAPTVTQAVGIGDRVVRVTDGGGNFLAAINNVDIVAAGGPVIDQATNPADALADVPITAFAAPQFATTGASKALLTGGTAVDTNAEIRDLFDPEGLVVTGNPVNESLLVTLRLQENLDATGADDLDDFNIAGETPLNPTIFASGANSTNPVLEFQNLTGSDVTLTLSATGEILVDGNPLEIGLAVDAATPLTTEEGGVLIVPTALQRANPGLTITPELLTLDEDLSGFQDGGSIDAIAPLVAPLPAGDNIDLVDVDNTATVVATTNTIDAQDPAVIHAVASDAALEALLVPGESKEDNLNTGTTSSTPDVIPQAFQVTSSPVVYEFNFDLTSGDQATLADVTSIQPLADGAVPVVLTLTFNPTVAQTTGDLIFVGSETLFDLSPNADGGNYLFSPDDAALQLLNLNAGEGGVEGGDLSRTTLTDDTFTFENVTDVVQGRTLTAVTGLTDYVDAVGFRLTTDGTKAVVAGVTTTPAPEIQAAVALRDGGSGTGQLVAGNVVQVIVDYDQDMRVKPGGAIVDGTFKLLAGVDANEDGTVAADEIFPLVIPGGLASIGIAGDLSFVDITVPPPGIVFTGTRNNATPPVSEEFLLVEYDGGVDDPDNVLQALLGDNPDAFEQGPPPFSGANDGDTRTVQLPFNTFEEMTQDLQGTIERGGAGLTGAIVRADIVCQREFESLTIERGRIDVPCNCGDGTTQRIALVVGGGVVGDIRSARDDDESTLRGWVVVTKFGDANLATGSGANASSQGVAATLSTGIVAPGFDPDQAQTLYQVSIDVNTGDITGMLSGKVNIEEVDGAETFLLDVLGSPSYTTLDDNGNFRLNVGVDPDAEDASTISDLNPEAGEGCYISTAVKPPGEDWIGGLTPAWEGFPGHTPFRPDLNRNSGNPVDVVSPDLGVIELDNIEQVPVIPGTGAVAQDWQVVPLQGEWATVASPPNLDVQEFMVTIAPDDGRPVSLWKGDFATPDQAFRLRNNNIQTAYEVNTPTVDNIVLLDGGYALAFENAGGNGADASLFVPVTGNDPTRNYNPGWALITVLQDMADPGSLATEIDAVIEVGGGKQAATWFRNETDNSLGAVEAGTGYFVHFSSAVTDFAFGK